MPELKVLFLQCTIVINYVFATGNQTVATAPYYGILGVNINYQREYRTLSNAHVFTQFDPRGIGNMIHYRPDESVPNFTRLFPVTGQVPVTYYPNSTQPNPTENVMDIAWGDVTDDKLVSPIIHAEGGATINPNGTVRTPKPDEHFMLGNYRLHKSTKIDSVICRYKSEGVDSSGRKIYTWWMNGITYTHSGTQGGDSGTAMVATSDKAVIGLHRADSPKTGYGCPIVSV